MACPATRCCVDTTGAARPGRLCCTWRGLIAGGRYSLAELGQALGPISLAAVSNARTKMLRHMASDPDLRKRVGVISKELSKRIK